MATSTFPVPTKDFLGVTELEGIFSCWGLSCLLADLGDLVATLGVVEVVLEEQVANVRVDRREVVGSAPTTRDVTDELPERLEQDAKDASLG
ncbi:hypothetical protein DEI83_04315 [Curtobacterium sp. MCBD17_021]|nr:hypothetical protein DEI83_04315 [Curtobacterium sp. MCBD17_021]